MMWTNNSHSYDKAHTSSIADYFFYVKDIIELDKLYSEIPVTFKKLQECVMSNQAYKMEF